MRRYEEGQDSQLKDVVCNGCGRELKVEDGYLKEGCFSAKAVFGYFSSRDGVTHKFDLCEECYDKMIRRFSVPVEESEEVELM